MDIQETFKTKVAKECDVLVCGGGFAGISAALSAARMGKKVILLEKEYVLGGLGTLGLVTIYLPICDGLGHQVCFGIAEELLKLSISLGAEDEYPYNWLDSNDKTKRTKNDPRFRVRYNPNIFCILAEKLLLDNGVEILYGTYAVSAVKEKDMIKAVITESKSGREGIKARSVVDATGDSDIAHFANSATENFKQGNILASWYYSLGQKGYNLNTLGFCDIPESEKDKGKEVEKLIDRRFTGLSRDELSQMTVLSHDSLLNDIIRKRETDETVVPTMIASIPQIRMSRKILGEYTLSEKEMHKEFYDSIGLIPDWRKRGPIYEIPFRTLYSKEVKNLITAGRNISVTDGMWDITRVIPCCAVTGEAAGTAAGMTSDFASLNISELQARLRENRVKLHETEL